MNLADRLRILVVISLRSLVAHRVKSAIVGGIMCFGTFLLVVGGSMLDSIEQSMSRSVTASLAGQLQVYSADAEDQLSLFGSFSASGSENIGEIPDFAPIRSALLEVPNVKSVVPMGIAVSTVYGQNEIDIVLNDLRGAVNSGDPAKIQAYAKRVRRITETLAADYDLTSLTSNDPDKVSRDRASLVRATSEAFWSEFDANPLAQLDFLDAGVAPLASDGRFTFLRMIGTDPKLFAQSFERFTMVRGEMIPEGKKGVLIAERIYEDQLKNKVARDIDVVAKAIADGETIAGSSVLREQIQRIVKQYPRILYQLSPEDSAAVESELSKFLPEAQGDLSAKLQAFLNVDDTNFIGRKEWFYRQIAPRIRLYDIAVGDTLTLRAFTKSGYVKSINVKVWGTYAFKGLEESSIAGATNLTDLVTWRDLYGKMSSAQQQELEGIRAEFGTGVPDASGSDLEASLFGEGAGPVEAAAASGGGGFDEFAGVDLQDRSERAQAIDDTAYSRAEMESGLALNAAILLEDPSKARDTQRAIEAKIAEKQIGLQVVDWQAASGLVGQFIYVFRGILYGAIGLLFFVAVVIINNAMVMATVERTPEIGTMRAIGAHRGFVMSMLVVETLVLGLLAGLAGAIGGGILMAILGHYGIGTHTPEIIVIFGGPRLYPFFSPGKAVLAMVTVTVVSVLSTLYPAILAALVPPITAMQGKE